MEKALFTAWAIFNVFAYAAVFSACLFIYVRLREKKLLLISLSTFFVLLYLFLNFRSKNIHHSLLAGQGAHPVDKVLTRQFIQVENLGAGNLAVLLSYNSDSVLHKKSRLYGLSIGHLWVQKSISARIEKNNIFYAIQGDMQWRLLGCLVYSQPKYFAENTALSAIE